MRILGNTTIPPMVTNLEGILAADLRLLHWGHPTSPKALMRSIPLTVSILALTRGLESLPNPQTLGLVQLLR